ncbi:cytochrome P450 26B1 isoform X1 [Paramormyrops kingsleyae]|uniref:Cytochrome P450 family 26 subfamily C member 1 n=1 Tax=Paramormyrops kingsleyae TaxID=1676925 RepID=A0A3B3R834_9TELE|nr:cytochrome P450 26B1 isoform X1 [Paramormyrops kingsleyae]
MLDLNFQVLGTAITSLLSVLLLLAFSRQIWNIRWTSTRDKDCKLPLPKGSMGWPLVGETFHWLFQGSTFHISRREKYGNVFKTHLLGKPVIRVTGAENIRKILLGEHQLVCTQWPQSTRIILGPNTLVNSIGDLHKLKRKILAKVFSHGALETYIPRLQDIIKCEIAKWCSVAGPVNVYAAARSLTFRIAVRVLLGLNLEEAQVTYLSKIFEQLINNLFSLPIDVSFSGLRKGIKAREILHTYMKTIIEDKLKTPQSEGYEDAFDYILSSANENNHNITIQELQETAVELIFAAHSTTASAATSLILQLLRHPAVMERLRSEIKTHECFCCHNCARRPPGKNEHVDKQNTAAQTETPEIRESRDPNPAGEGCDHRLQTPQGWSSPAVQPPYMSMEKLARLHYLDCVIKEVLRFLPPVSGGYRTALQTFELDGYQIPKGWSVMYSIRDTHETAAVYQNPELFDPDRFGPERDEGKSGRFHYVPFGGGIRSCIGKELARVILKILTVELMRTADWRLATETFPKMQTVPVVHPVNGLHVYFNYTNCQERHL